ncbi:MAG: hypothetical protein K6C95_01925 [Lachnospiraceae bacterium]|nr:hypothetical protein [Lachnospiraceae bacterium]
MTLIKRIIKNAGLKRISPAFVLSCLALLLVLTSGCAVQDGMTADETGIAEQSGTGSSIVYVGEENEDVFGEEEEDAGEEEAAPEKSREERLEEDIAAGSISWDNAPEISDRDSLMKYMRRVRDAGLTEAPVLYKNGYFADYEEILKAVNLAYIDFDIRSKDEETGDYHVLYNLTYYPGERVANAYKNGSMDGLTEEETYLYREAAFLVEEAAKLDDPLHRELFLHDQIIGRATYHNRKERVGVPRFCTAVGAILDGQANCQGYSDAFWMLAKMAGFEVGKQSGTAGGEEHMWNTILIGGKWYAVDCTWDDASYVLNGTEYTSYACFNAPEEILSSTHSYEDYTVEHRVVERLEDADDYFYLTDEADEHYFGHTCASMDDLIKDAAGRLTAGERYVYSMAPRDERYKKYREVKKAIDSVRGRSKSSGSYVLILANRGDFSFVTIDASGSRETTGEETQTEGMAAGGSTETIESAVADLVVHEDGVYTTAEDVSLYIHIYGKLPRNFITKNKARDMGWNGGGLEDVAPGMCIGGDRFGNYEGRLPEGSYRECDIDTLGASSRGAKRIIYSDDGRIYYTEDHYESFTQLY